MYALIDKATSQVVAQRGQTNLTFDSAARVDLPNGDVAFACQAGHEWPGYKLLAVTEITSGSGPIIVSVSSPVYDSNAQTVTVTTTRRAETAEEADARKTADATSGLGTIQNKTILDALWELHRAIRGVITLPTETKAQYADRLKAMWRANEP